MTKLCLLAALAVATLLGGCAERSHTDDTRSQCEAVRAQVVDLQLDAVAGALTADERERHRANLENAMGQQYVDDCERERTPAYLRCALEATSLDALRECS